MAIIYSVSVLGGAATVYLVATGSFLWALFAYFATGFVGTYFDFRRPLGERPIRSSSFSDWLTGSCIWPLRSASFGLSDLGARFSASRFVVVSGSDHFERFGSYSFAIDRATAIAAELNDRVTVFDKAALRWNWHLKEFVFKMTTVYPDGKVQRA